MISKIGVFSGSFDPIHQGHLHLATFIKEHASLDQVIFSPVNQSPGKSPPHASSEERLQMVCLAIEGYENILCDDWEAQQKGVSFTFQLIDYFKEKYPDQSLHLLMSGELYQGFALWKNKDHILQYAHLLVGRGSNSISSFELDTYTTLINMPMLEASSSIVRAKIKEKKSIEHLVPEKVRDFISNKQLYS